MSQSNSSRKPVWLVVAALVLLIAIPFAIHQAASRPSSPSPETKTVESSSSRVNSSRSPGLHSTRKSVSTTPPSHHTEELKSFLIPSIELKNVTLEEAMETLILNYRKTCEEMGESPIDFRYSVKGDPTPIVFLRLKGDFLSSCRFIASMAATTLEIEDDRLVFTEVEDGPVVQRRWTVPPTFESYLPKLNERGELIIRDPNSPAEDTPNPGIDVLLSRLGALAGDSRASLLTSSGTLITRAGMKNHVQVDGLVANSINQMPIQSRILFEGGSKLGHNTVLLPGRLEAVQVPANQDTGRPEAQFLISVVEKGFGREIQAISFTGEVPSNEARELYMTTGNLSGLGINENLTYSTHNIMRGFSEEDAEFSFKDQHGTLHQLPFTSVRLDATGRILPTPAFNEE